MTEERLLETARRLSVTVPPGDLDHTLGRITSAAVEVLPEVQFSSITILHDDGSVETVTPTDEMLREIDKAQYRLREGPCYATVAVAAGVNSQMGIPLFDTPSSHGALNLYSSRRPCAPARSSARRSAS